MGDGERAAGPSGGQPVDLINRVSERLDPENPKKVTASLRRAPARRAIGSKKLRRAIKTLAELMQKTPAEFRRGPRSFRKEIPKQRSLAGTSG